MDICKIASTRKPDRYIAGIVYSPAYFRLEMLELNGHATRTRLTYYRFVSE